jgi:hypothetical protein
MESPVHWGIWDPKEIAFAKDETFRHQDEYRLVFGARKAFRLTQTIVDNRKYNPMEDVNKGIARERLITIGDILDVACVRYV